MYNSFEVLLNLIFSFCFIILFRVLTSIVEAILVCSFIHVCHDYKLGKITWVHFHVIFNALEKFIKHRKLSFSYIFGRTHSKTF